MNYYFIDEFVVPTEKELNASNGYSRAVELTPDERTFYLSNLNASYSEIKNLTLNPAPQPQEPSNEISYEERIEALEMALLELIGGA